MKKTIFIVIIFLSLISNAQMKDVLVPYRKGSLWGYSDSNGKIMITPVYDSVTLFESVYDREKKISINYSKVYQNNKVGMLSNDNRLLFPIQFTNFNFEYDSDRFTITDANGKMGLRDFNKTYLPIEYERVKAVRNESYVVQKNGKIGLADYYGKIVIPMVYDQLNFVSEDDKLCKWKVVNEQETKYVFTPLFVEDDQIYYDTVADVGEIVDKDKSREGELTSKYDWVQKHFEFDYAFIFRDEKKYPYEYGFINVKSKNTFKGKVTKLEFLDDFYDYKTQIQHFVLLTKEDDKSGIIDETGKVLVPNLYEKIYKDGDYCKLILGDSMGFYFPKSNQFIEAKYKDSLGSKIFGSYSSPDFIIIAVYESSKQDWYYLGQNGVVFKE